VRVVDKRTVVAPNGTLITGQGGPFNVTAVLRVSCVRSQLIGAHMHGPRQQFVRLLHH
jgi:hypothetical protein